jgi:hypothetical protein
MRLSLELQSCIALGCASTRRGNDETMPSFHGSKIVEELELVMETLTGLSELLTLTSISIARARHKMR